MFTRCPHCNTVFRITEEQLSAADGRVRCGRCRRVFNAGESLTEALEPLAPEDNEAAEASTGEIPEPADKSPAEPARIDTDTAETGTEEAETAPEASSTATPPAIEDDLQGLLNPSRRRHGLLWAGLIIALALLLAGQYVWFMRDQLAQSPRYRPWIERLCEQFGCHMQLRKDLSKLRLLSRDVMIDPGNHGTLLVNATMVNTATFAQAYPVLEITLSNARGERTAMRRFQPAEYLPQGTNIMSGMPPDTPIDIHLKLVNPDGSVASYQFTFR
jgi:predicted Zn finger-like uncharacterized protein